MDKFDEKAREIHYEWMEISSEEESEKMLAQTLRDVDRDGEARGMQKAADLLVEWAESDPSVLRSRHATQFARRILRSIKEVMPTDTAGKSPAVSVTQPDAADACFGEGTCAEESIEEVAEIARRLAKGREDLDRLLKTSDELVAAMETCHACGGTVLVDEYPVHCESCSSDCDDHEEPPCESICSLHLRLKREIDRARKEG